MVLWAAEVESSVEMEGRLPQEVVELCLQEEEEGGEDCPQLEAEVVVPQQEAEVVVPQQEGGVPVRVEEEGGEVYDYLS